MHRELYALRFLQYTFLPPMPAFLALHPQFLSRAPPLSLGLKSCSKGLGDDECEKYYCSAPGLSGAV